MSNTPKTDALRMSIADILMPFKDTQNKQIQEELILATCKKMLTEYSDLESEITTLRQQLADMTAAKEEAERKLSDIGVFTGELIPGNEQCFGQHAARQALEDTK